MFKEMLVANKECSSATLEVSNEGLARINFKVDDYDSTYYIVAMTTLNGCRTNTINMSREWKYTLTVIKMVMECLFC